MFAVVCTSVGNILERHGGIHPESFGNGLETLRTEGTFRINVDCLLWYEDVFHPR